MSVNGTRQASRLAIVTVHGTGDTADSAEGQKWFQKGASFAQRLVGHLAERGFEAEILPHLWSGANSARERELGAEALTKAVLGYAKTYDQVHVIGHSHGGNVANDAASMLGWWRRRRARQPIASITTVGTPFFKLELSGGENFSGVAFTSVLILSTLALLILGAVGFVAFWEDWSRHKPLADETEVLFIIWAVFMIPLVMVLRIALKGLRRILRLRAAQREEGKVHSIWHPNDEAIAFLQNVEGLPIEPFPKGAIWRSSRNAGVFWGVWLVILSFLFGVVLLVAGLWIPSLPEGYFHDHHWNENIIGYMGAFEIDDLNGVRLGPLGWLVIGTAILGAPILFILAYAMARLLVFGLFFEVGARRGLNRIIGDVLRGMAFGRDGDEQLGKVATCSHTFGAVCTELTGALAARMKTNAAASADRLIAKYRWALFTVGPDTNAAVKNLASDALTWDSLIHTTYFDQPEIADLIGDYIAEAAARGRS